MEKSSAARILQTIETNTNTYSWQKDNDDTEMQQFVLQGNIFTGRNIHIVNHHFDIVSCKPSIHEQNEVERVEWMKTNYQMSDAFAAIAFVRNVHLAGRCYTFNTMKASPFISTPFDVNEKCP